jgi:predicted RNase H-like HicB family nuclease
MNQMEFTVKLPVKIIKCKNWYVASCPSLDVHSQGETERKARQNLREALSVFFTSCLTKKALRAIEDRIDLEGARKALREKGGIPWNQAKAELGL